MVNQRFVIEGGHPIGGRIRPSGNKNAALPLIAATLLTDDEVVLTNVPAIRDVEALVSILRDLGVTVTPRGAGAIAFRADRVNGDEPNPEVCKQIRASILLAGPLLAQLGRPTVLCHRLVVDDDRIVDYRLRMSDHKRHAVRAFKSLNYRVVAAGDSYNDTTMLAEADTGFLFRAPDNVRAEFPQFPALDTFDDLYVHLTEGL